MQSEMQERPVQGLSISKPSPSPWLVKLSAPSSPAWRMFCFPYAGGSAYAYAPWSRLIGADVELLGIQLPGRGSRFGEPPLAATSAILEALVPALAPWLDRPFVFFGHSMGALLGYEAIRRLAAMGGPLPRRFFVSGANAPGTRGREKNLRLLSDGEFLEEIRLLGGTPDDFFANPELVELALPALRADIHAVETHCYGDITPLDVPVTAFGGLDDRNVPVDNLLAWRGVARSPFVAHVFDGHHFFIDAHRTALLELLNAALARG